jgi:hypothetical protein
MNPCVNGSQGCLSHMHMHADTLHSASLQRASNSTSADQITPGGTPMTALPSACQTLITGIFRSTYMFVRFCAEVGTTSCDH